MNNDKYSTSYQFGRIITKPVFTSLYHPTIINEKVIPEEGPVIFCGNHLHVWDQVPVICSTKRTIHWMAKKEYFESKLKYMYKFMGCIPVDREGDAYISKEVAIEYLKLGSAIGIFPEGTRNQYQVTKLKIAKKQLELQQLIQESSVKEVNMIEQLKSEISLLETNLINIKKSYSEKNIDIIEDEELLPFHFGTVSMAKKTGATLVPFGITGDYKLNNKNLILSYGTPFKVSDMPLEEANNKLRGEVLSLVRKNREQY